LILNPGNLHCTLTVKWFLLLIGELSESGAENHCVNGSFSASSGSSSCLSDTDSDDALMVSQELRPGFRDQVRRDASERRSRVDSGEILSELPDGKTKQSASSSSEAKGSSRRNSMLNSACAPEVNRLFAHLLKS
jgi:hypothetical protein